jgi:hypothetical protein
MSFNERALEYMLKGDMACNVGK